MEAFFIPLTTARKTTLPTNETAVYQNQIEDLSQPILCQNGGFYTHIKKNNKIIL